MATILLPTIEGPHVADSRPLVSLIKAPVPGPRSVLRAADSTPVVSLVASVAPATPLSVLVTERLRLKIFTGVPGGPGELVPQIEGVHVADARPLVTLSGAVVGKPPLSVMVATEHFKIRSPHRVRRVNKPR